ncbi:MAG: gamma-glutamyltransferase [Geminicoccaceae bacterium]|nr:gamma-glutamyltransferase [Geminicoccaceae bacterium]MDW8339961.1 gamma-glutamyltransferase [Geminicoccaceae bacterium]
MRDFQLLGRPPAYGVSGMAATSVPSATLVALDVLRAGGNAVDAAIAAAAVLAVVEPAMTGIGGDCFALVAPASGGVFAVNGSGRAPAAATIERLRAEGLAEIPPRSVHAVTVPGALRAWELLLERFGTKPLAELLRPAIRLAEEGFPVTARVAWDWRRHASTLRHSEGAAAFYLPGGRPPAEGRIVQLPALARTLERIATEGVNAFYEGPLAEKMVASLRSWGGVHSLEDFAAQRAELVEPIHTSYRDLLVYECPPNGQGVVALQILNVLEGFELGAMEPLGAERLHLLAEAAKLAFRDRDALLADPAMVEVPVQRLLDKDYAARLRETIDPERAARDLPPPLLAAHKDTVYLCVVDRDLNVVSFINSLFEPFGSGLCCPETGVLFHNRGASFRLDPAHPNALAPGKRPMHTIIPALAFKGGEAWLAFGVMGGHFQPMGQVQLLSAIVDHGLDPQAALELPRVSAYPFDMEVERRIPAPTRAGLQERGHLVLEPSAPLGGGQAILVDRKRGVLVGGSDPRKDGLALGW